MNVLIFGAGGKTGALTVDRALAAGHTVTAFVHEPGYQHAGVRVLTGDTSDLAAVRQAVVGQNAVIDAVGGKTPYKATELETNTARNVVAAMQAEGVRRLIVISMLGMGDSAEKAPFWYEHLLLPTFLRGARQDKAGMESAIESSGLDFVIARPPVLSDDPGKGSYAVMPEGSTAHKMTRADLATFLVDQLQTDAHLGKAVVVANS